MADNQIPVVNAEEASARAEFLGYYDNALKDVQRLLDDPSEFVLLKACSDRQVSIVSMASVPAMESFVVCMLTAIGTERLGVEQPEGQRGSPPELALMVGLKFVNDMARNMYAEKIKMAGADDTQH